MHKFKAKKKVTLSSPNLDRPDILAVVAVLESAILARGPQTEAFEKEFSKYAKAKEAVAVSNGTAALHLAVRAMGWKRGDEVLTSPFTFVASSNCLLYEGIKPIFVDIDPKTLNIDFNRAAKFVNSKTKGILLPHVFGSTSELKAFKKFQKKFNLPVVEDACEALGRPSASFAVGKFGKVRAYSFFENKVLSCGEGGMLVLDDSVMAEKIRSMRNQGRLNVPDWMDKIELGFNYRLTEMQAALGLSQLKKLDLFLKIRADLVRVYEKLLKNVPGLSLAWNDKKNRRSWFVYYILLDQPAQRDQLRAYLAQQGIETSTSYFNPLYKFAYLKKNNKPNNFPITEKVASRILALPLHTKMTKADVFYVVKNIKEFFKQC